MREALADYPPCVPPLWDADVKSLKEANDEYTSYFNQNRSRRVDALRNLLAKFDIALSLEDDGVKAVSAWLPLYGDLLVDGLQHQEDDVFWYAYYGFQAPWVDSLIGLNPIFDLGVYMGECMLHRNARLKWWPSVNPEPCRGGAAHPIFGQRRGRCFDPVDWAYTECKNTHSARITKRTPDPSVLFRVMQAQSTA